jgi:hypothetical protein
MPVDGSSEWVELLLGPEWAAKVTYMEEHHDLIDSTTPIVGSVETIYEVRCRRVPEDRGSGVVHVPVPRSGVLTAVKKADKWTEGPAPDAQSRWSFDGWIVALYFG